ncbi:MAG TPA: hypothetical protein GXX25_07030 [Desulfotomaculum sp.]|nr:hypothetical protein [Desulfotomaculum sp.]
MKNLLDAEKERAALVPPQHRDADRVLGGIRQKLNEARADFAGAEAALEKARADHGSYVAMANLLAAYVQAGRDTTALETAIAQALGIAVQPVQPVQAPVQAQPQAPAQQPPAQNGQGNGLETGTFTVLEVRSGKSPGVVRAYCQAIDGTKHAVYAKNGAGQALAGAVGKTVEIKYRQGDRGLIALDVRLAG